MFLFFPLCYVFTINIHLNRIKKCAMFVSKSILTETGKDNFSKTTLPILESERKRLYISSKIDDSLPPNSLQINQCTSILTFSELPTILEETCSFSKQREGFYTFCWNALCHVTFYHVFLIGGFCMRHLSNHNTLLLSRFPLLEVFILK